MDNNNYPRSGGTGFLGLLTIVFITLKLTGYITWPWYWVLAPLWIPFVIFALIMIGALVISLILYVLGK